MHGNGISVQTLIIASLASASAAILTSFFWESGTVFSAAFTPVLVTLLSEALKKPAQTITQVRSRRASAAPSTGERARVSVGRAEPGDPSSGPVGESGLGPEPASRTSNGSGAYPPNGAGAREAALPRRTTYSGRRRLNVRLALVTAAVAFLIAGVALTVPELLTGQSLAGQSGRTTLGGGSSSDREEGGGDAPAAGGDQPNQDTPSDDPARTETAPSATPQQPTQAMPEESSPPGGSSTTPAPTPPSEARPKPPEAGASGVPRESAPTAPSPQP